MEKELQEKVLLKIGNEQNLTEKEERCLTLLERKGLIEISHEKLRLTNRGKIATVMGLDSLSNAEHMEQGFADFSTENIERNKSLLLLTFALLLFVLLTTFWMYFEDLFYL